MAPAPTPANRPAEFERTGRFGSHAAHGADRVDACPVRGRPTSRPEATRPGDGWGAGRAPASSQGPRTPLRPRPGLGLGLGRGGDGR